METLNEDWDRALAIVAHPDDLEYGASSAIARWTAAGKWVGYVIVSDGEAGIDGMHPSDAGRLRREEQIAAGAKVGVTDITFLGLPDGVIEYGIELRRLVAGEIRKSRPDVLITATNRLTFGDRQLNQADHRNVALAVLDAARDAGNRWVHPELGEQGLAPHANVTDIFLMGSTQPTHAVDVSAHLEAGIASLEAHAAYLTGLGRAFDPAAFLRDSSAYVGRSVGVAHAVAFEVLSNRGM